MKKFIVALSACVLAASLFAEIGLSINVDPLGYMNHTIKTSYDTGELANNLRDEFINSGLVGELDIGDQPATAIYNAYALGLDVTYSFFYANVSLGLPTTMYSDGFDPISIMYPGTFSTEDKIGGTIILDGQLGGGIDLMKLLNQNNNMTVFLGGGVAVNYIRVKRPIRKDTLLGQKLASAQTITEFQHITQAGLGFRADVEYYFAPNIGVNLNLTDSIHFIKLFNQRVFSGQTKSGLTYTYRLTKEKNENKMIKSQFSNNFVGRLGLSIKF